MRVYLSKESSALASEPQPELVLPRAVDVIATCVSAVSGMNDLIDQWGATRS